MRAPSDIPFDRLIGHVIVSAIFAALGYFVFSLFVGWHDVIDAVARIGITGLVAALALSALNYTLRFVRWQMYLRSLGQRLPNGPSALIYLSGFAFTTTPGKAGELVRGIFLNRRGTPYLKSTAAFFSERLSDLLAVLLLALPGLALLPTRVLIVGAVVALCGLGVCVCVVASGLAARAVGWCERKSARLATLAHHVRTLVAEARRCHSPGMLACATGLSLLAWGAEALAFALLLHLLGVTLSVSLAVFIYAASMIAGALSFLPGGLGGAEAMMVGLLALCGAPHPESVAATILIRFTTLWFAVVLGIILAVAGRRTLLSPAVSGAA